MKCFENLASKKQMTRLLESGARERSSRIESSALHPSGRSADETYRTDVCVRAGGASRDRTGDLLVANQTLSQLSYGPVDMAPMTILVGLGGVAPPTSPLSGVRSN